MKLTISRLANHIWVVTRNLTSKSIPDILSEILQVNRQGFLKKAKMKIEGNSTSEKNKKKDKGLKREKDVNISSEDWWAIRQVNSILDSCPELCNLIKLAFTNVISKEAWAKIPDWVKTQIIGILIPKYTGDDNPNSEINTKLSTMFIDFLNYDDHPVIDYAAENIHRHFNDIDNMQMALLLVAFVMKAAKKTEKEQDKYTQTESEMNHAEKETPAEKFDRETVGRKVNFSRTILGLLQATDGKFLIDKKYRKNLLKSFKYVLRLMYDRFSSPLDQKLLSPQLYSDWENPTYKEIAERVGAKSVDVIYTKFSNYRKYLREKGLSIDMVTGVLTDGNTNDSKSLQA